MKLTKKSLHIPMLALSISVLSLLAFLPTNKVNAQQNNSINDTPKTIHITETNISNFNQSNKSLYQHKNIANHPIHHANHHIYNALPKKNNLEQNAITSQSKANQRHTHYNYIKKHLHHKYTRAVTPPNNNSNPITIHIHFHKTPIKVQKSNWFKAGLSNSELKARQTIVNAESRGNWNILSYGHRCIGYFQLDPSYLGYKHGHINLDPKHQVKIANKYVANRYGSWKAALRFRNIHGYY